VNYLCAHCGNEIKNTGSHTCAFQPTPRLMADRLASLEARLSQLEKQCAKGMFVSCIADFNRIQAGRPKKG